MLRLTSLTAGTDKRTHQHHPQREKLHGPWAVHFEIHLQVPVLEGRRKVPAEEQPFGKAVWHTGWRKSYLCRDKGARCRFVIEWVITHFILIVLLVFVFVFVCLFVSPPSFVGVKKQLFSYSFFFLLFSSFWLFSSSSLCFLFCCSCHVLLAIEATIRDFER